MCPSRMKIEDQVLEISWATHDTCAKTQVEVSFPRLKATSQLLS